MFVVKTYSAHEEKRTAAARKTKEAKNDLKKINDENIVKV